MGMNPSFGAPDIVQQLLAAMEIYENPQGAEKISTGSRVDSGARKR
jgi:hypothetical protein